MAYATVDELLEYLGEHRDPPARAETLLERASELVDQASFYRIDTTDADHAEAARLAACAQVEYWMEAGEAVDVGGNVAEYQIGNLRVRNDSIGRSGGRQAADLARRARRHLLKAGLLYRGVSAS